MRTLTKHQRHMAALELVSAKEVCLCLLGKGRGRKTVTIYGRANVACGERAAKAALAGSVEDADDLCKISDYFTARSNPGSYCGGFQFPS